MKTLVGGQGGADRDNLMTPVRIVSGMAAAVENVLEYMNELGAMADFVHVLEPVLDPRCYILVLRTRSTIPATLSILPSMMASELSNPVHLAFEDDIIQVNMNRICWTQMPGRRTYSSCVCGWVE